MRRPYRLAAAPPSLTNGGVCSMKSARTPQAQRPAACRRPWLPGVFLNQACPPSHAAERDHEHAAPPTNLSTWRFVRIWRHRLDATVFDPILLGPTVLGPTVLGTTNRKMLPCGRLGVAHSLPPWAVTIERHIHSPKPMPSHLVVNRGSKMRSISAGSSPVPVSSTATSTSPFLSGRVLIRNFRCRSCTVLIASMPFATRLATTRSN